MDKEILDILKAIQNDIADIKQEQCKTDKRLESIEKKIDLTYDQVARTAEDITSLEDDINTVETITAKNWQDISKLKAIK